MPAAHARDGSLPLLCLLYFAQNEGHRLSFRQVDIESLCTGGNPRANGRQKKKWSTRLFSPTDNVGQSVL